MASPARRCSARIAFLLLSGLASACSRADRPVRGIWSGRVETSGAPVTRANLTGPAQCRLLRHRAQDLVVHVAGTSPGPAKVSISDVATGAPRLLETAVLTESPGAFDLELRLPVSQLGKTDWVGLGFEREGLVIEALEIVEAVRHPRVVVLGIDALTWNVLDPLLAAGRLPHFQALIRGGVAGPLESAQPLLSPVIWTTIATGQGHGAHGIHGFLDPDGRLVNSSQVKVKRLWEIVGEHAGATVGVTGWFVTWPVEPLRGFMLSDRATSVAADDRPRPDSFQPAFLRDAFDPVLQERRRHSVAEMRRFTPFPIDPDWRVHLDPGDPAYARHAALDPILLRVFLRDSAFVEAGLRFFEALLPDLLLVYLRGSDHVQHGFWFHRAPGESLTPVDAEERRLFGGIIDNYYAYLDEALGRLVAAAPPDTIFVVVSDHGFHSEIRGREKERYASARHATTGVYIVAGPGFRRGVRGRRLSVFDLVPLWLHVYGLPAARDMRGRIPLDLLEPVPSGELPRIASYGPSAATETSQESAVDADIVEQLKALGYIN